MTYTADQFKNNATSRLIGGAGGGGSAFNLTDTAFTIIGGDGAHYSATGPFMLAIGNLAGTYELVKCTTRAGDNFTVIRGQEGTLAQTWPVNTPVTQVITAGSVNDLWTAINSGRSYNVFDYGAVGDGVTDDTPAINNALAAASVGGGIALLPTGTFRVTSTLLVNADNVALIGSGWGSVLKVDANWNSTASPLIWYQQPSGNFRRGCILRDFSIDGQSVSTLLTVIQLDGVRHADINHIEVHHAPNTSIFMNGTSGTTNYYGAYNTIRGCTFRDSYTGTGLKFTNSEWCTIADNQFVLFNLAGSQAINLTGGLNCNIVGNQFDAVDEALHLVFNNYTTVTANQFDEGNTRFIYMKACQDSAIVGNAFHSRTGTGTDILTVDIFGTNGHTNLFANNTVQMSTGWTYLVHETNSDGAVLNNFGNIYSNNSAPGLRSSYITGRNGTTGIYNVCEFGAIGDGVTDDTAAIQAAIVACQNASGGTVLFPDDYFLVSSPLLVSGPAVVFAGSGRQSTYLMPSANFSGAAVIRATAADYLTVRDLTFAYSTNIGKTSYSNPIADGIQVLGSRYATLQNLEFRGLNGWAIQSIASSSSANFGATYHNIHVLHCGSGIHLQSNSIFGFGGQHWLSNLNLEIVDSGDALLVEDCNDTLITNYGGAVAQGSYTNSALHVIGACGSMMATNLDIGVYPGTPNAPVVLVESNANGQPNNVTLVNGILQGGTAVVELDAGTEMRIADMRISKGANYGVRLTGTAGEVVVDNCVFANNGFSNSGAAYDYSHETGQHSRVTNSYFRTTQGSTAPSTFAAIHYTSGNLHVYDNYFDGGGYTSSNILAGTPTIVRNNYTLNPKGLITVTMPASGVASATQPYDCTVYLSAGAATISQVAIGGTATGLTSGMFRVPARQTITVTYTVSSPSWTWFAD